MSDNPMTLGAQAAAAISSLPRKTWTIPESARNGTIDPGTIKLRHLTFAEEKAALEAHEHGGGSYLPEGAMRALCAADGKPLTWTDNQIESFFKSLSPKTRDLVERAFGDFCIPNKKEQDDFLASGTTEPSAQNS